MKLLKNTKKNFIIKKLIGNFESKILFMYRKLFINMTNYNEEMKLYLVIKENKMIMVTKICYNFIEICREKIFKSFTKIFTMKTLLTTLNCISLLNLSRPSFFPQKSHSLHCRNQIFYCENLSDYLP